MEESETNSYDIMSTVSFVLKYDLLVRKIFYGNVTYPNFSSILNLLGFSGALYNYTIRQ